MIKKWGLVRHMATDIFSEIREAERKADEIIGNAEKEKEED